MLLDGFSLESEAQQRTGFRHSVTTCMGVGCAAKKRRSTPATTITCSAPTARSRAASLAALFVVDADFAGVDIDRDLTECFEQHGFELVDHAA